MVCKLTKISSDNNINVTEEKTYIKVGSTIPITLNAIADVNVPSPSDNEVLSFDSASGKWINVAGGGDVVGPSSSTDNNIVTFDGTTGKVIKDSGLTITQVSDSYSHISSDGTSHSHVVLNDTHRGTVSGNPHNVTLSDVGGTTDHTLLSNIGTNSHVDIDNHISDTDIHYNQSSISIPASQITDFDVEVSNNTDVVDNTSKAHVHTNKSELDLITDGDHDVRIDNPHVVTKTQVGLSNVPNIDTTNASNITTGTLPSSVIPPVALTTVQVAVSEAAQLALTTEEGDVVVRSDENKSYMHNGGSVGDMTDFTELQTPTDSVLSVNGEIGTVVLTTSDINEDVDYRYMSDAQETKLDGIESGAEVNVQSDWNQTTVSEDDYIKNKPSIPSTASDITIIDTDDNFNADNAEDTFKELAVKENKNGYDRYNPDTMPDATFDGSTRTVSISVKSGQSSFGFYVDNKWVEKTSTQTIVIPDTTGAYYVYFDNDGVLQLLML